MLFESFRAKPQPNENQIVAKQITERRRKEKLIEKFTKDFHEIDTHNAEVMYEYMIWNIKDIFWTFTISRDLREGLFIKGFLNAIYDVITQNKEFVFTKDEIIGFNDAAYFFLVAYDVTEFKLSKEDYEDSKEKVFEISRLLNKNAYEDLKIFSNSYDEEFLNEVLITRNSSFNESINIRRVNFIVFEKLSPWVYEDLDILDRYRNLFWNNIDQLFLVSMFDVYNEEESSWYTHTMSLMDGWITNAVIYLLDELPITKIKQTLIKYSEECLKKQSRPKDVRCSIRALSSDYSKVRFLAEELYEEGYYII